MELLVGKKNARKRGIVELTAFDGEGKVVEEVTITVEDYYQGLHQLLDDGSYRARRQIVALQGRVYSPSGELDQQFRNKYSSVGAYTGGRTVYADGTINEE